MLYRVSPADLSWSPVSNPNCDRLVGVR